MAKDKKSFIAYCDWKDTFDQLTDEYAGKLIKHLFSYVNDENPQSDDMTINAVFATIKNALKRDLVKFEEIKKKRSDAGKLGGRPKQTETKEAFALLEKQNEAKEAVSVSDTVSVNGNDSSLKKNQTNRVLSEVKPSEVPLEDFEYYEIALNFQKKIKQNLVDANGPTQKIDQAKYETWVKPIRLMMSRDKITREQINTAAIFALKSDFWNNHLMETQYIKFVI